MIISLYGTRLVSTTHLSSAQPNWALSLVTILQRHGWEMPFGSVLIRVLSKKSNFLEYYSFVSSTLYQPHMSISIHVNTEVE